MYLNNQTEQLTSNIMNTLELLSKHDLHVHQLSDDVSSIISTDTHYIMKGSDVVVKLNRDSVDNWVHSLDSHVESVKACLLSGGLDIKDEASCIKWLSDTVLRKKNVSTYKMFFRK